MHKSKFTQQCNDKTYIYRLSPRFDHLVLSSSYVSSSSPKGMLLRQNCSALRHGTSLLIYSDISNVPTKLLKKAVCAKGNLISGWNVTEWWHFCILMEQKEYFLKPTAVLSLPLKFSPLSVCMFESWLRYVRIIPMISCLNILVV